MDEDLFFSEDNIPTAAEYARRRRILRERTLYDSVDAYLYALENIKEDWKYNREYRYLYSLMLDIDNAYNKGDISAYVAFCADVREWLDDYL